MIDDYATKQATYDEQNSKLTELLVSDPSAAEFIQRWVETGDPRTALVEIFGDDLGMSEEGREGFKEQLDTWRARRDESRAADEAAESNYKTKSLPALDAWGDAKGLTLEQKRDVMVKLIEIAARGAFDGTYTEDDFNMVWNAMNHDSDVDAARQEGEVNGRNARIAAARRDRNVAGTLPPAPTGRQGGSVTERPPQTSNSPWAGIK